MKMKKNEWTWMFKVWSWEASDGLRLKAMKSIETNTKFWWKTQGWIE